MPLLDITNPRVINFLSESYEKESRLRLAWTKKYSDQFQCSVLQREPTNYRHTDIRYVLCARGIDATTRDHVAAARHKRMRRPSDLMLIKTGMSREVEPTMLPIDSNIKELMKESSEEYFKQRYKVNPEDKFNFPETSSWKYGWRLKDSMNKSRPAFPKVNVLFGSMYSKVHVQPDPDYYVSSDLLDKPNFCA